MALKPTVDQVEALNERSRKLRERSLLARLNARDLLNRIARWERERAASRDAQGESAEPASSEHR